MKLSSNLIPSCMAGLGLILSVGCTDSGSVPEVAPANAVPQSGAISGPLMNQTGSTVVEQIQTDVADNYTYPAFKYITDTQTNTTGDGFNNNVPDVIYDEKGRGIEVKLSSTAVPYLVTYNDNDTIATITRELGTGENATLTFNYADDKLVGKTYIKKDYDGFVKEKSETTYTYDRNGNISSADVINAADNSLSKSYGLVNDDNGRVSQIQEYDENRVATTRHVLSYDKRGNIIKVDEYDSSGALTRMTEYKYVDSKELTVNIIGFFASTHTAFLPRFDLLDF